MGATSGNVTTIEVANYGAELLQVGEGTQHFNLLNMIGGVTGGNMRMVDSFDYVTGEEWSLAAASQPTIDETDALSAPTATYYGDTVRYNTCQIHQYAFVVSYKAMSTPGMISLPAGSIHYDARDTMQDRVAKQSMAHLQQVAADFGYSIVNGSYQKSTAHNVDALTGGITNDANLTTVSGAAVTPTRDELNTLLDDMVTAGAPLENPVIFCTHLRKAALTNLFSRTYADQPRDRNEFGADITLLHTDFGPLGVVADRSVADNEYLVLDMNYFRPVGCPVPGKGVLFVEPLAVDGAGVKYQIYGQLGIDYFSPKMHGKIYF